MSTASLRDYLALIYLPGIGPGSALRLLARVDGVAQLLSTPAAQWGLSSVPADLERTLADWRGGRRHSPVMKFVDVQMRWLEQSGDSVLTWDHPGYPELLRQIPDPPPLLFVRGNTAVLSRRQLAIVGSRKASAAGRRAATELAGACCDAGIIVTSGLALGIDAAAHRGALSAGGPSVAVVATGLDVCYPRRHQELRDELLISGAIVSEFPYGNAPQRHAFPRRNRVISGLSDGVLVVEAGLPSGSLITAGLAGDQGRDVFAVPGSIYNPGSRGCHQLLRDGAVLVESFADIARELGLSFEPQGNMAASNGVDSAALDARERAVLETLDYTPQGIDELQSTLGLPVSEIMGALSVLEVTGLIEHSAAGYQRR